MDLNAGIPASFGEDVKRVRLARGMTQRHLGVAAGYSEGYVSKVEAGLLVPHARFAEGCDKAFHTGGLFVQQLRRITEGEYPSWFEPFLEAEREAEVIEDYSTLFVFGLLQTPEYAHAVLGGASPGAEPIVLDASVAGRVRRRQVMERERPPQVWVILHEACLWATVGTPEVMAGQLRYLLNSVRRYPTLTLQVLPLTGSAAARATPFTLLKSRGQESVHVEGPQGGRPYSDRKAVEASRRVYDHLRACALGPHDSLDAIDSAREAHEREVRVDKVQLQRWRGRQLHRVGPGSRIRRKLPRPGQ